MIATASMWLFLRTMAKNRQEGEKLSVNALAFYATIAVDIAAWVSLAVVVVHL